MSYSNRNSFTVEADARKYPVIDFADVSQVGEVLYDHGVCVITNVFRDEECLEFMDRIVSNMEVICGEKRKNNRPNLWDVSNLPPQTRHGLFQATLSNLQPVWEIRKDERITEIFRHAYNTLRQKRKEEFELDEYEYDEKNGFVSSIDGINIQDNVGSTRNEKDWAHLDQTLRDDIYKCVQGQALLTTTTASFRATPGSHKHFHEFLDIAGIHQTSDRNWCKFSPDQCQQVEKVIKSKGLNYQIPIRAPKGSFIVWLSSTVHSAMSVEQKLNPIKEDPYLGWRGVIYVCHRPVNEYSVDQLARLEYCVKNNRCTNHWGTKMFPVIPGGKKKNEYSQRIQNVLNQPSFVYHQLKWAPHEEIYLVNKTFEVDDKASAAYLSSSSLSSSSSSFSFTEANSNSNHNTSNKSMTTTMTKKPRLLNDKRRKRVQ